MIFNFDYDCCNLWGNAGRTGDSERGQKLH